MVGSDKLYAELPQINRLPEFYHLAPGIICQVVLLELILDNPHSKLGGINGYVDIAEHIRQRADVVFVPMGNHKSLYLLNVVFQISYIRDDQINSEHVILRKRKTAVYNNNTVFVFKGSNVHTNLLKASKRNNLKPRAASLFNFFQIIYLRIFYILCSGISIPGNIKLLRPQNLREFNVLKQILEHGGYRFQLRVILHCLIDAFP